MTDPYEAISVDPSSVTTFNVSLDDALGLGRIVDGSWDTVEHPLEEIYIYSGLCQRFEEGRCWSDTDYVRFARDQIEANGSWSGYEGIDQFIDVRCAYVDELYERIRSDGYQPNSQRSHDVPERSVKAGRARYIHELEPLVVIARDGEIQLRDGFHRVTIAKLLGIAEIPVLVLARHTQWQHRREEYLRSQHDQHGPNGTDPPDVHPDLPKL